MAAARRALHPNKTSENEVSLLRITLRFKRALVRRARDSVLFSGDCEGLFLQRRSRPAMRAVTQGANSFKAKSSHQAKHLLRALTAERNTVTPRERSTGSCRPPFLPPLLPSLSTVGDSQQGPRPLESARPGQRTCGNSSSQICCWSRNNCPVWRRTPPAWRLHLGRGRNRFPANTAAFPPCVPGRLSRERTRAPLQPLNRFLVQVLQCEAPCESTQLIVLGLLDVNCRDPAAPGLRPRGPDPSLAQPRCLRSSYP